MWLGQILFIYIYPASIVSFNLTTRHSAAMVRFLSFKPENWRPEWRSGRILIMVVLEGAGGVPIPFHSGMINFFAFPVLEEACIISPATVDKLR